MSQGDILNGFTGFSKSDSGFVSAADAIRQAEREMRALRERESAESVQYGAPQQYGTAQSQPSYVQGQQAGASASAYASLGAQSQGQLCTQQYAQGQADRSASSSYRQSQSSFTREQAERFTQPSYAQYQSAYFREQPEQAARSAQAFQSAQPSWGYGNQAPTWNKPKEQNVLRFATEESIEAGSPAFDPEKLYAIPEQDRRWSWIEIDLNAIRSNVHGLKSRLARGTRVLAVVKADAYGHGAVKVAKTALNSGADYLGVASIDEAIQLREAYVNAPILILCEPPDESIPLLLGYKVMPSVYTAEFAIKYAEAADAFGLRAPFHLKVNTGMNRIGVHHAEVVEFMHQVGFHRALELVGTYTHFATADCPETLDLHLQVRRFVESLNALNAAGINPGIVHAANSAAALRYPEVQFDMVRTGLTMYGYHSCPETQGLINLKPAMSVHARVTDVRQLPMSEGVSYGMQYRSPGSVKVCTVPIGYADGLRRSLSGKVDFVCGGKRFHQIGAICMDQCMFEVDLRTYGTKRRIDPQIGDEVIIVGSQGDAAVTIEEMCRILDTIPYELIVGFSHRMPKVYR